MTRHTCRVLAWAVIASAWLVGCGDPPPPAKVDVPKPIRVGVFQIVEHPVVNELRFGFEEAIKAAGTVGGRPIELKYKNAQNDAAQIEEIARSFIAEQVDLVYALGTPVVVSIANKTRKIPIVAGAMTDPVAAAVAESWEKPGRNVTGTSDLPPVKAQLELAKRLLPQLRVVGVIYNSGESNSVAVMERARVAAKELGLELAERTVVTTTDVAAAATSLVGKCQAVYVPPDNTVHAALPNVLQTCSQARLPVFDCTADSVKQGALFALTVDYRELGRLSGRVALSILEGKDPASMPFVMIDKPALKFNSTVAKALEITLPQDVLDKGEDLGSVK